jgi:hypothetical protein
VEKAGKKPERRQRSLSVESPMDGPTLVGFVELPVGPCGVPISNPVEVGKLLGGVLPPPNAGPNRFGRSVS